MLTLRTPPVQAMPVMASAPAHHLAQRFCLSIKTADGPITAQIVLPGRIDPTRAPLLALHGISRDADALVAAFAEPAEASGRVLIVPKFDEACWPEFQRIGKARPDRALLALIDMLRDTASIPAGQVDVFGFSGGAQLAHRFAMLYPHLVRTLHVAAAGWYCVPDDSLPYPAGLAPRVTPLRRRERDLSAAKRSQLDRFLQIALRVYVGAEDTLRDDATRREPGIDAVQGLHRRQRAQSYARRFAAAAAARGIAADVRFDLLAGCGHDFTECATKAGLARLVLS